MPLASRLLLKSALAMAALTATIPLPAKSPAGNGTATASLADSVAGPAITWDNDVADFGKFDKVKTQTHTFKFTNTGSAPLVIQKVFTDCGCTTANFPKKPIKPGEQDSLSVSYRTIGKAKGYFMRVVRVKTNAAEKPSRIFVKGQAV